MTDAALLAAIDTRFSAQELERLAAAGRIETFDLGRRFFNEGDTRIDFVAVLEGAIEVRHSAPGGDQLIRRLGPSEFLGDVANITGAAAVAYAEAVEPGRAIVLGFDALQRLLISDSILSDLIVSTFIARRAFLRAENRSGVALIGRRYDRQAFAIRDLLTKSAAPFAWIDADDDPDIEHLLGVWGVSRDDLPALVDGRGVLSKPTLCAVAERFGLALIEDGQAADVIIIGSGPGGLAAAVYAGSEGLSVIALDGSGAGGQAGTSSKIENYLGFPTGLSGRELAERAAIQAQKFGAKLASPVEATALERHGQGYAVRFFDGRRVFGRAVVLATGARYRRLPIQNLEAFEGSGVFYGATPMEAQLCGGQDVAVVGAGNSAGQGAVFLAKTARTVHLVFRRPSLRETMSEYLVRRLEETPNVVMHSGAEISALHGCDARLRRAALRSNDGERVLETPFVFLFIGAEPCTDWLSGEIELDDKGFVKTGEMLSPRALVRAGWSLDRMPSAYETSWPRVYAVGDVRAGSIKRVASAVGEGSVVVSSIHQALAELERESLQTAAE